MNRVPPSAVSNSPALAVTAPVKAPFSWPNSSLSSSVSGKAAQLITTIGRSARLLCWCKARATSSLPVPLSPWIRMALSLGPARSIKRKTSCIAGDRPIISDLGWPRSSRALSCDVLFTQLPPLEGFLDQLLQFLQRKRLGQVVVGAQFHGLHGRLDGALARQHDEFAFRRGLLELRAAGRSRTGPA